MCVLSTWANIQQQFYIDPNTLSCCAFCTDYIQNNFNRVAFGGERKHSTWRYLLVHWHFGNCYCLLPYVSIGILGTGIAHWKYVFIHLQEFLLTNETPRSTLSLWVFGMKVHIFSPHTRAPQHSSRQTKWHSKPPWTHAPQVQVFRPRPQSPSDHITSTYWESSATTHTQNYIS